MPLASPSSLTSNTLATFLDHVPISTNNAEKWKPKQMGSNSSGDYWALSRALSAPLGVEKWIPQHLFLSTGTEVGGEKKQQLQQYVHTSQKCLSRGSNSPLFFDMRNECNRLHLNLGFLLNCGFFFGIFINYKIVYIANALSSRSALLMVF